MNVIEALELRHSVRAFRPDPIDREVLTASLQAALRAPSWANTQPWELFVATGASLEKLREAYLRTFREGTPLHPDLPGVQSWPATHQARMTEVQSTRAAILGIDPTNPDQRQAFLEPNFRFFGAPAVAFLCMDKGLSSWSLFDLGAISQSLMLAAKEQGVDSVPAFSFGAYPELVRTELGIPDELQVVVGIALGYADPDHPLAGFRSTRRPFDEVVRLREA